MNKQLPHWQISIFKWIGNGLICVGASFLIFNLYINSKLDCSVGTVTAAMRYGKGVKPTVFFQDKAGAHHVLSSSISSSSFFWSVGDKVPVYFKQGDPHSFRIGGFVHQYLAASTAIFIGLFFRLCTKAAVRSRT